MPVIELSHREVCARGGRSGCGSAKARTTEQARRAANARWERWRVERAKRIEWAKEQAAIRARQALVAVAPDAAEEELKP